MQKRIPIGGDMAPYLDLLARYRHDPESVPVDWKVYFEDTEGPRVDYRRTSKEELQGKVREAVSCFRTWGHLAANLDPLEPTRRAHPPEITAALQRLEPHLETELDLRGELGLHQTAIGSILSRLRGIYADRVGAQFDHISDPHQRAWLYEHFERAMTESLEPSDQLSILHSIVQADEFEKFLQARFPTKSRFGIEGAESFLVFLQESIAVAARAGFQEIVMGGMHRGRLNMLANVLGKPLAEILAEVKGRDLFETGSSISGDVPYHLGYSGERLVGGQKIRLSISAHPSHLMAIAPVALGRARAKQSLLDGIGPATVLCMLLHTDAAFSGQGLTSEILQLGTLNGFSVGGTVHCVVNNQLGFTTLPSEGRTSRYCTDIGRAIDAPILHINSEYPEMVLRAARLAIDWRREFGRDVIIDLVCYRRNGHNEFDEPRFTQPRMYAAIDDKPPMLSSYINSVSATVPDAEARADEMAREYRLQLARAYDQIETYRPSRSGWLTDRWSEIARTDEIGLQDPPRQASISIACESSDAQFAPFPRECG
jgi:2-oxoglutarate dehydrogenase E1 component